MSVSGINASNIPPASSGGNDPVQQAHALVRAIGDFSQIVASVVQDPSHIEKGTMDRFTHAILALASLVKGKQ
jgi:hypothetical protein